MKILRKKTQQGHLTLLKAVTNVKEKLKRDKRKAKLEQKIEEKIVAEKHDNSDKIKLPERGVIYLGHIPHGFYEEQIQAYFKQFGKVMRVRLSRSKKTGKSKGYGYIEFAQPEVAEIAAKSMNNYLMCGRLLKATYIPPEKQNMLLFTGNNWTRDNYPKLVNQKKEIKKNYMPISKSKNKQVVTKSLKRLQVLENKLKSQGINIKFKPV